MKILTTREAAARFETEEWKIRRLFETGTLPEPEKFGGKRVIPENLLPAIQEALIEKRWIPESQEVIA